MRDLFHFQPLRLGQLDPQMLAEADPLPRTQTSSSALLDFRVRKKYKGFLLSLGVPYCLLLFNLGATAEWHGMAPAVSRKTGEMGMERGSSSSSL